MTATQADRTELWRLAVAIVLFLVLTLVFSGVYIFFLGALGGVSMGAMLDASDAAGTAAMLGGFIAPALAIWLTNRIIYRQGLAAMTGPAGLFWRQAGPVLLVLAVLMALAMLLPSPELGTPRQNMELSAWLSWLPVGLVLLVIQVGSEEVIFRGFLQGRLAARFGSRVIVIGVPAVIFGVLHTDPTAGDNTLLLVANATLFGLIAGDLTHRSGTLAPAIAMHLLNNFIALFCVAVAGPLSGLALYVYPVAPDSADLAGQMPIEAIALVILWLAARIALRR